MENKRIFISYSWDTDAHKEWVHYFANLLRKNGVDAEIDAFETQLKSTNLNKMMVEKVRDSDFIIIVLTENYANKANNFEGGVGFESQLALPLLMENPSKLIYIMKHQGDYSKVFPFHLKGQYAIDFSDESSFEEKFNDLLYRIYEQERYYKEPLGTSPNFMAKVPSRNNLEQAMILQDEDTLNVDFSDLDLPTLKRITDHDIDRFLKRSFKQIIDLFNSLFTKLKSINTEFDYDQEDINNYKTIFILYVDGKKVNGIKIWYGSIFGSNTINLLYGNYFSTSDNSVNDTITHYIDAKKQLKLKMAMNLYGNNNVMNAEEIVKEIWKNNISHSIR